MASNDVTLTIGANLGPAQRQLQAFIQQSQRQLGSQSFQFKLDDKGFRQPLGRITGDLNQFQGAMDASIARTLAFGASVGAIAGVTKAFKDLVAVSVKVEHSLKEINVLLNLSTKELSGFSKELFGVAKNTASSFDTVTKAATEFSRQGLGAAETAKRVNAALILTRLSGLDAEASVSALTAAVNGFRREAVSTTEVVNRLANVDAAFAVSSADLAKALSRAGSVSQDAKVKFNELLAAVTAVQQATARGGNVIGNGFKTIFTRLQRSKVRSELEKIGVATTDSMGNMRGAISVLKDYARVYKTLSDQQKAYTSEQVAGVFQINTLKALINDLGNEYGVYSRALAVANNTTNEAVQRNAELNKTLQSLASQTGTEIAELASKVGAISFEGNFKGILGFIKSALGDVNKTIDSEGIGGTLARGVLQGFGDFITGPGMAIALVGITRLLFFIGKQTKTALLQVFQIGTASQKRQIVQQRINALLAEDNMLLQQIMSSSGNINDIQKIVVRNINQQNAALANQKLLVSQIAAGFALTQSGGIAAIGGGGSTPPPRPSGRGSFGRGAQGFVPNMVRGERASISQGVGGARAGDRPVVIPNFSFGGGKSGTMVAHTGEYVVPNFASGGSAIFNREMVSSMGLPSGARRVAARGFVPNFVSEDEDLVYSIKDAIDGDTVKGDIRIRRNISNRLANVDAAETNQAFGTQATGVAKGYYEASIMDTGGGADRLQKSLMGKLGAYGRLTFKDEDLAKELVEKGFGVPDYRYAKKGAYTSELTKARGRPDKEGAPTTPPMGMWKEGYEEHPKRIMVEKALGLIAQRKKSKIRAYKGARDEYDPFGDIKKKKGKRKGAAGGFIPNFVNYPDPRNPGKKVSGGMLKLLRKRKEISDDDFNASMDSVSGKNEADAIYKTNQIVALVSNKMGKKKAFEFATGTKDAVGFTATGTKSLSADGPQQVEQMIAPAIYAAADEVFRRMTNQEPAGGITNIPDGLKKMAGSVFEAAAQKVVGTTQFKGNQNLDMPVVTGANKELLEKAFNIKGLTAMDAAEIKLGYNKALMQDVATKIIRSKRASRGQGGPIAKFHGAGGFIPSFANLAGMASSPEGKRAMATEKALTGSARMGYDSRVGYGVFNNSQGSLGNAVSQHLNSGDSAGSLASAGEAAQAAVAAAAAGFVPSLASPFPIGSPSHPNTPLKVVIDPASAKKTGKELGDGVKKGGKKTESGLAKVMAISFVAQAAAGSMAQSFAKREDFESKQAAAAVSGLTQGAAAGASIGAMIPLPGGELLGGAIGAMAALAPILDSTGQALKKLQFEVQKSAEAYSKNQSAIANYIDLLAQYQTEGDPGKRTDLADQMGVNLNMMSADLAGQLVVLGKSNLAGAKEIKATLEAARKDVTLEQSRDLATAKEATASKPGRKWWEQVAAGLGSGVGELLYDLRTGDTRTERDPGWLEKLGTGATAMAGETAMGFTADAAGVMGMEDLEKFFENQEKFWAGNPIQKGNDLGMKRMREGMPEWMPGAFDRKEYEAQETRMEVREARERIGQVMAFEQGPLEKGADETKAEALERGKEIINLGQIIKDASMGQLGELKKEKDLTVGDVFKKLGMEGEEIPKQLQGQLDTLMIDAARNFDDAASREIIQILGEAADKIGKQTEEAFDPEAIKKRWIAMAEAAAKELESKLKNMKLSREQIFGKIVGEEQRSVITNTATSKFQDELSKVRIAAVGDFGVDGDKGKQTKADRVAEIERESIKRGEQLATDKLQVKFLGDIAKAIADEEDEDQKAELVKIREQLALNKSAKDILDDKILNVQGEALDLVREQLYELKAIETAAIRQNEILKLNGLRQEALLEETRRQKVKDTIKKGAPGILAGGHKERSAGYAVAMHGEGAGAPWGSDLQRQTGILEAMQMQLKNAEGFNSAEFIKTLEGKMGILSESVFLQSKSAISAPGLREKVLEERGGEPFEDADDYLQSAISYLEGLLGPAGEGIGSVEDIPGVADLMGGMPTEMWGPELMKLLDGLKNVMSTRGENEKLEAYKKAQGEADREALLAKDKDALTGAGRMDINAQMGVTQLTNQQKVMQQRLEGTGALLDKGRIASVSAPGEDVDKIRHEIEAALKQIPGMSDEYKEGLKDKGIDELLDDLETLQRSYQDRADAISGTLAEVIKNGENVTANTTALGTLKGAVEALTTQLKGELGDEEGEADPIVIPPIVVQPSGPGAGTGGGGTGGFSARGYIPSMAAGGWIDWNKRVRGAGGAMAAERRAINGGVGGAIPGVDRARLINLNGSPAAINTGEKLVNNYKGTGETAVLNRDMQGSMGAPGAAGTRGVIGGEAIMSGLEGVHGVARQSSASAPLTSTQRLTGRGLVPKAVTKVGMGAKMFRAAKNFLRPGPVGMSMMAIDAMHRMAPEQREAPRDPRTGRQISEIRNPRYGQIPLRRNKASGYIPNMAKGSLKEYMEWRNENYSIDQHKGKGDDAGRFHKEMIGYMSRNYPEWVQYEKDWQKTSPEGRRKMMHMLSPSGEFGIGAPDQADTFKSKRDSLKATNEAFMAKHGKFAQGKKHHEHMNRLAKIREDSAYKYEGDAIFEDLANDTSMAKTRAFIDQSRAQREAPRVLDRTNPKTRADMEERRKKYMIGDRAGRMAKYSAPPEAAAAPTSLRGGIQDQGGMYLYPEEQTRLYEKSQEEAFSDEHGFYKPYGVNLTPAQIEKYSTEANWNQRRASRSPDFAAGPAFRSNISSDVAYDFPRYPGQDPKTGKPKVSEYAKNEMRVAQGGGGGGSSTHEEKIRQMRANAASLGGGFRRGGNLSQRGFSRMPSQFNAAGYIPNLSLGSPMVSSMNASNHFLNFAEGSAPAAATSAPAPTSLGGGQTPGEALITKAKASQEKHNVNVNIEVYGNVSQDQVDKVQSSGSDTATLLEELVNGGL